MHKNYLSVLIFLVAIVFSAEAQSLVVSSYIQVTDTIDDGGILVAVSADDAEQENDAIDALYDDDLDAGWEGAPEDQNILTAGLRFRNIGIPKGARIDSAFLILHSHEGKSAEDVARITIAGEANDDAKTFTEDALITSRSQTGATVLWQVAEEWEIWEPYRTPDLKEVIQEIVSRNGWNSGQALALFMLGENQGLSDFENAREFESFENISDPEDGGDGQNHPERVPQLVIYFSVNNARMEVAIAVTDTIDDGGIMVAVSSDDAEQENDAIDALFDDDLDAGWEGAPEDQNILTTGMRFRNIQIPKGAIIDSAFIQVWSHEGKSAEDVARILIVGDDDDNPPTYTEDALISTRPQTDESVLWEVAEVWEIWEKYQTPDIGAIVQEIIERGNWQPGNAIAFSLLGMNQGLSDFENAREFESFENISDPEDGGDGQNHPERRPKLVVYFSSATTSLIDFSGQEVKDLKVYPNPTGSGEVTIELDRDDSAVIQLFNANGQLVKSAIAYGKYISFSTAKLAGGMYVLKATQDQQVYAQKLVITE